MRKRTRRSILAQSPLAVDVVGVLRAIAERGRVRHRLGHARALDLPEVVQLGLQARAAPAAVM
jgi:hypothetical protein